MKKGKNTFTYVAHPSDDAMHTLYERGLEQVTTEFGLSNPVMIGGKKVFSDKESDVVSPLDRQIVVGKFQEATPALIRSAVAAAQAGFPTWRDRDWKDRAACIRKTARILDDRKFVLAALITYECGKNRYEALAEVTESIDMLRYHAEIYEKNKGFVVHTTPESPGAQSRSIMCPYGVWAVISPFNFPLSLAAGMAGAALITGNGIILKPTSIAPFSVLKLYQAFIDAGVPEDAVQYVTAPGRVFGGIITAHPDIDGIAFTGSREAGMLLYRTFAAQQRCIKPFISEMGSKNPVIVSGHADIGKAVEGVFRSAFGYSGQKCSAASRVYVHESIAERFIADLRVKTGDLRTGDPRERDTFTGPLIDGKAQETFREAVDQTKKDGGTIVCGGDVLTGGIFSHGYYVQPTIIRGLPQNHPLVTRELFVPFLIIDTFSTLAEALDKANASEYGLTAGFFSERDEEVALFFSEIQSGVTYVNRSGGATTGAWPGTQSFCGWKASGSTGRGVGGPYYLLSYMREQAQTRTE